MDDCFKKRKLLEQKRTLYKNVLITSKRSANLIETGPGKEFFNKIFTDLLDKTIVKRYSRFTSLGAVYAERFIRTIRDLLKRPVFERGDGN